MATWHSHRVVLRACFEAAPVGDDFDKKTLLDLPDGTGSPLPIAPSAGGRLNAAQFKEGASA